MDVIAPGPADFTGLDRPGAGAKLTAALCNAPIPSVENRYYDGLLYLMSLMHVGGEFRI